MSTVFYGATKRKRDGGPDDDEQPVTRDWEADVLEQVHAVHLNRIAKTANVGGGSLLWQIVWAEYKAFFLVRDFGHVNMMTSEAAEYTQSMVAEFNSNFIGSPIGDRGSLLGNRRQILDSLFEHFERLEIEVEALTPLLDARARTALIRMSKTGAAMVAGKKNVLPFKGLSHPMEFEGTEAEIILRTLPVWETLPAAKKTLVHFRVALEHSPEMEDIVHDQDKLLKLFNTYTKYGGDVRDWLRTHPTQMPVPQLD
jgi:hypothetical protein